MRLYNKLMDQIPEDAVTPSLILHNMVEQVIYIMYMYNIHYVHV